MGGVMPFAIDRKLVVGVSSNALFNLQKEDEIYRDKGITAYRKYQIEHKNITIEAGSAFLFIKHFLRINEVYSDQKPVEVVLLSKNSPETGVRIFNSIKAHELSISRGAFTSGDSPYKYIPAYNISLFLSTNEVDVTNAIEAGYPAGRFINTSIPADDDCYELRVAFDFDGVIANDDSERIYQSEGIEKYNKYETDHVSEPNNPGPLADFFKKLSQFQKLESRKQEKDPEYKKIIRTAIITARSAPAHERAINTLKAWGVTVDDMFLLGGIDKNRVLSVLKPHLFMDDQISNLDPKLSNIPLVHIPFGIRNKI
jgi:5'-nucleotidase